MSFTTFSAVALGFEDLRAYADRIVVQMGDEVIADHPRYWTLHSS